MHRLEQFSSTWSFFVNLIHTFEFMWQSHVEIKDHLDAHLNHITCVQSTLSLKGGAHHTNRCTSTKRVWALPITKVLQYSTTLSYINIFLQGIITHAWCWCWYTLTIENSLFPCNSLVPRHSLIFALDFACLHLRSNIKVEGKAWEHLTTWSQKQCRGGYRLWYTLISSN